MRGVSPGSRPAPSAPRLRRSQKANFGLSPLLRDPDPNVLGFALAIPSSSFLMCTVPPIHPGYRGHLLQEVVANPL